MCELTEVPYMPGDIVWVKLGSCWWPGEVKDFNAVPEEIVAALKKKPIAVVKFFGEDSYEYVKNLDNIYHYNNRRKMEFIKKGMDLTRAKSKQGSGLMDKFPTDVITAESLTNGDINILSTVAFVPEERTHYKDIFGDPRKKSPKKNVFGKSGSESKITTERKPVQSILGKVKPLIQLKHRITHPRFVKESDHEVRIRQQPNSSPKPDTVDHAYKCQQCDFGTSRQNVYILHCKAHRENIINPVSNKSPASSQSKTKATTKSVSKATPRTPKSSSICTPSSAKNKASDSVSSALERRKIFTNKKTAKKGGNLKVSVCTKATTDAKKSAESKERDLEKRNKILADWDEEDEEEEEKEIKKLKLELVQQQQLESTTVDELHDVVSCPVLPENSSLKGNAIAAAPTSDPSTVYDIIEDSEEFSPPPRLSETKRLMLETAAAIPMESADTQELDKKYQKLMEETSLPDIPQIPAIKLELKVKKCNIPETNSVSSSPSQESDDTMKQSEEAKKVNESEIIKPGVDTMDNAIEEPVTAVTSASDVVPTNEPVFTVPVSTEQSTTPPPTQKPTEASQNIVQQQSPDVIIDPNTETATYVLVTIDDSGGFQQFQTIEGMSNTLLAYDSSQGEEGVTRTLYIDPSQLSGTGSALENLFLAIDSSDGSGPSMVQIQPNQVLQVSGNDANSTILSADDMGKSKQDILAVALANTQVLQPSVMESHIVQDSVVKVTNTAQSPVMTSKIADSQSNKFLVSQQSSQNTS